MKLTIFIYVGIGILLFLIGVLAGIQIGTYAVIDHVAYGLAGSTFVINVNETKIVDEAMKQFNQTVSQQLKLLEKRT